MAKAYSDKMVDLQLLVAGLREGKEALPAGITEETIKELESFKTELEDLNSKQEIAKVEVKRITSLINKKTKEMEAQYAKVKKRIKIDIDAALWRKFGIEDKK